MMELLVTIGALAVALLAAFAWLRRQEPDVDGVRLELDPAQLPGVYYRRPGDTDGQVFVAGAVIDLTGFTSDQFDAGVARLDDLVMDEDRARLARAVSDARLGDGSYSIEYRLQTRQGETRWVYDRGRLRRDERGALLREGMLVDVTPRKIYEQRQREQEDLRRREQQELVRIATSPAVIEGRITEAAQLVSEVAANLLLVERAGVWLLSEDGRALVCVDLYERTPRRHAGGASITASDFPRYFEALRAERGIDAVDAAQDPRTREFAANYLSRHEITSMLDATVRVAGQVRGVLCLESVRQRRQWSAEELAFAGELADQFAGALNNHGRRSDASERRRLEAELIQAQKMEAIGHLTAGIAHDFNNIITAVSGYTSLARTYSRRDPDMLNACLSRIDDAIRRSRLLVKQLMKFGASSPTAVTRIDLGEQLAGTLDFLRAVLPSSVEVESSLSLSKLTALFDADQLDQVILNLALNGSDAMEGQGLLHISTDVEQLKECFCDACHHAFSGSYALIRVSDTGSGIGENVRAQMFEPFFTTKGEGRGTGLGLAMVNRLMHEYGGHVAVSSEPGRGTTFTLYLPLAEEPVPHRPDEPGNVAPVLVVDDDAGAGSFLAELLMSHGYRVRALTNPADAIALVRDHPGQVRLLVTDYSMPEMDGVMLARELYALDARLPVLLVSGYGADINIADFGNHNIRAMFAKPIETEKLLAAVRQAVDAGTPA
ncbi:MAG: ATP-binding protein [Gammaproteobacteria bacterium]